MRSPRIVSEGSPDALRCGLCRRSLHAGGGGTGTLGLVDFYSAYAQGFARVAACTLRRSSPTRTPTRRRCSRRPAVPRRRRRGRDLPRAVPDRLRHRRPAAAGDAARRGRGRDRRDRRRRPPTCARCWWSGRRCAAVHRLYNCAVVIHRGQVLGVAPKCYLPTYREFYERRYFASGTTRPAVTSSALGGADVPFGPDLLFRAADVPGPGAARRDLRGHVGAGAAQRGGGPGRRDRAGEHLRQRRSPSPAPRTAGCWCARRQPRCLAAYLYAAAGRGRVQHRPVLGRPDDGLRGRRPARGDRALPRRPAAHDGRRRPRPGSGRSGCGRAPSTTTAAPRACVQARLPDDRRSPSTRRPATSACAAGSTASRSCPTTPSGSPWTATRPTTSRSPDSSSGCARSAGPRSSSASPAVSTRPTR